VNTSNQLATRLRLGVAGTALMIALGAAPAFAQTATVPAEPAPAATDESTIVVTGSIFRQKVNEAAPVVVLSAESLDQRGISTLQSGIQSLAANNGPALTNSFTANGAFAAGASAASLRGLSTNSTLVLFDGLRAAYYPLADDGSRNFVDLNTVADDVVERTEILLDGASANYGADAIAGVVNIITKREFKGIKGRIEGGVSQLGDAQTYRAGLTAGVGDLRDKGFNAYISGFYYKSAQLNSSGRRYPYNSDDLRNICFEGTCGGNNVVNGRGPDGLLQGVFNAGNYIIRPYDAANAVAQGPWQNLSGCGRGTVDTVTAADRAVAINANLPSTVCGYDYTNLYGVINPDIERFGLTTRVTADLGGSTEAYFQINFLQTTSGYTGDPAVIRANAPTGIAFPRFSTQSAALPNAPGSLILNLPVFVCPFTTIGACTAANGRLNPQNPFAALGQVARITGRDTEQTNFSQTRNRSYRAAFGVTGNITDKIKFDIAGTAMHTDLEQTFKGYVYIQHLLDVIKDGSYNFANPSSNSQALQDYLKPTRVSNVSSDLYQLQATVGAEVLDLPGGALKIGGGGSIYYEAVDAPSKNDDYNGPTQRYFSLNAFGTVGKRTVASVFGEVKAPIIEQVELSAAGRYDHYSSGQSAFSPKFGVKFTPIKQVVLRGNYSKGFRIPSFAEANALPTTGFVTNNASLFNNTYLAQYGCTTATFTTCPTYIRSGSYGQTTIASPNLNPEKSRSFTAGAVFKPIRNVTLTIDYYNIKKTGAITQPSNAPALLAYYQGQAIPAGYNVIADAPDVNFPNARPRVAFVQAQLINANTVKVSGIDFSGTASFNVGNGVKVTSSVDASLILKLSTIFPDGTVERYDGTLGNFNLTAGSGTPKWHGNWLTTVEFGDHFQLSGTVNYFGGYNLSAQDQGTGYKDCGLSDGTVPCDVKAYTTIDLNANVKVSKDFSFYVNVQNLFNRFPPLDPITYGAHLYNPVQGGDGILGRYFKAGVKFGF
jgi:iron complex outermembrane recepter protein